MSINEMYDMIVEYGITTEREIELITHICGFTIENMNNIVFERTGYSTLDDYLMNGTDEF